MIVFPPALYAGTLVFGSIIHFIFPISVLPRFIATISGAAALLSGVLLLLAAVRAMRRFQTSVNPSEPTTAIVTSGIFAYTRNPIYVAFTLAYLGIALLVNSLWMLVLLLPLSVILQNGIVKREERYLERKFGEEYLSYKANVRRWL